MGRDLGGNAISDVDKENIDIGNTDAGKTIASILVMSTLEAHNAQVAVVAARNGVSDPSDQQFQETLYFQGATQNLMKDPTINLSYLREYASTAPNIALPGGEVYDTQFLGKENGGFGQRNNRLEESAVASSSSNDQATISPLNAAALTVLTLQSLVPFDPAPGLAMKKPPPTYPAKKKGLTHKTSKSAGLKIFNSASAAMCGTQVRMPSASSQTNANQLMTGGKRDDIINIDGNDSVISTLSFNQKPICPKKSKAIPCTALVSRARNAAISSPSTPVLNMDIGLPSSPDSTLGKDVAHFFSLPIAPLRDMAGYVLETKKDVT
eukprot:jgi/Psemu1/9381/gm1.9381_g